jgi:hypothetical protein
VAVRRASFLVLVIAVATTLPAGIASGAGPESGTVVRVALALKATNGLQANLENSEDGTVTLELRKKGRLVTYEAPGDATETGLKVRFGRLGLIDVAFDPTKVLNSTAPGEGCTGAPRTLREGVFTGTIDFTGERGFVRIDDPRTTGSMSVISRWECPEAEAMDPLAGAARRPAAASRDGGGNGRSATLAAASHACSCSFVAEVHRGRGGGRSIFFGAQSEEREGMKIRRATEVRGRASAFRLDPIRGTAILRPPSPLTGQARYEARAHGRGRWRSTIRVPLLGADPIDTGAPGFAALFSSG